MDIAWGSWGADSFVKNVGLVTSNGPRGEDVMAAESTFHISYSPGIIAVAIGPERATTENIRATKEFGVSIAASDQNVAASVAGKFTGKTTNKIAVLKELGVEMYKAEKIDVPMFSGAVFNAECRLVNEVVTGDHVVFFGEVVSLRDNSSKSPLIYSSRKYFEFGGTIEKPGKEYLEKLDELAKKNAKAP